MNPKSAIALLPKKCSKIKNDDLRIVRVQFEWNREKAIANLSKHGVSFEEAKTVFEDPLYVDFYDPDHSDEEERYLMIGESNRGRLLIVSYTGRGELIRIIGARELTRREREAYSEG
jgi:hypothetical protein